MKVTLVLHKYGVPINDPCCWPLGYMYISSALKAYGHDVKVLNYNLWDYDLEKEIAGQDAVCFTGFEEFKDSIIRDASLCRSKGIHTVLGGALATFTPDIMSNHVDALVIGEGEYAVNDAIKAKGMYYGTVYNLDELPLPDYEGFGIHEYIKRHDTNYIGVLTSRGCPYSCSFCAQTCACQNRSLLNTMAEIEYYQNKYKSEMVIFNDNTLNSSRRRFLLVCGMMRYLGMPWGAAIRADIFDEDMARAAKHSGCQYFVVGVESFNQDKLNAMNKGILVDDIYRTLNLLEKYKINYHGNVLVGFEGESYQDIIDEVDAIPDNFKIFPCMVQPFIGTGEGHTRSITDDQYNSLQALFRGIVENAGKYLYPELRKTA
jgi:anaerobic magnesium-protoporphyrin IX monomethyl ester cyclase